MKVPSYTCKVLPVAFKAVICQGGIQIWHCDHTHVSQQQAQACALAEREIMREQEFMACPICHDDVEFLIEHLDLGTRDWFCQPRTPKKKTTTTRRKVRSV
jgi:hypothetical protein